MDYNFFFMTNFLSLSLSLSLLFIDIVHCLLSLLLLCIIVAIHLINCSLWSLCIVTSHFACCHIIVFVCIVHFLSCLCIVVVVHGCSPSPLIVISPDFSLELTGFFPGKHLIHFLVLKMKDFRNFVLDNLTLNKFT